MRLGIIGNGVVGSATAKAFAGHVDSVLVYDADPARSTYSLDAAADCDLHFVCLPETAVDRFFDCLPKQRRSKNWVLKSTVPIGTTRRLRGQYNLSNLVHSPEFLTERTAEHDAAHPVRNIIGDPCIDRSGKSDIIGECPGHLWNLYRSRWLEVPIHRMTSDESEAVKLFQNAHSAIKVSVFNEFRSLCDELGMDWETVRSTLLAGGWISPHHTVVPGHHGRGYAGRCLPKDVKQLLQCYLAAGVPSPILAASDKRNEEIDRRVK